MYNAYLGKSRRINEDEDEEYTAAIFWPGETSLVLIDDIFNGKANNNPLFWGILLNNSEMVLKFNKTQIQLSIILWTD